MKINPLYCLIEPKPRRTVYWHQDPETKDLWCYCNACGRGYSIYTYCSMAGVELKELLKVMKDADITEVASNEVRKIEWPAWFMSMSDPRAKVAVDYVKSRGLTLEGDMFYDEQNQGIAFPMFYDTHFCGAQTRLFKPWVNEEGKETRILTIPGTRTGLLFYNWNSCAFLTDIKGIIITEGAFDALSIQQSLNKMYGGVTSNPWKVAASCGAGVSINKVQNIKDLKNAGIKVVIAPDNDEAGIEMLSKFLDADAVSYVASTGTEEDWNDVLKRLGHDEFAKWFMTRIKPV